MKDGIREAYGILYYKGAVRIDFVVCRCGLHQSFGIVERAGGRCHLCSRSISLPDPDDIPTKNDAGTDAWVERQRKEKMASKLQGKSFAELRTMARKLGLNPSGKNAADLIRMIEKAQKGNAGKGTAADPKPKGSIKKGAVSKKVKPKEDEEDEEDDDEDEEEEEAPKASKGDALVKKAVADIKALDGLVRPMLENITAAIIALGKEVGAEELVTKFLEGKAGKKSKKSKPAEDEDEDDSDEEDDEDEADEEEESDDDSEDEDESEDEEEDEDEEEEGPFELTEEELASMDLDALQATAKKINKELKLKGSAKIDSTIDVARKLRKAILETVSKHGQELDDEDEDEEGDDEDEEEDEKPAKKTSAKGKVKPKAKGKGRKSSSDEDEDEDDEPGENRPDWMRVGAKVKCDVGEDDDTQDWQAGAIASIDDGEETCHVQLDDGTACDAPWQAMKPLNRRAKKRS